MSSFKTGSNNKKLQPGTVIVGENGLPVDTVATIAGSYQIIVNNTDALSYSSGVVTVVPSIDLLPVRFHKARYTGRMILETKDKAVYFIDRVSVDNATHTFSISNQIDHLADYPASIDLSPGWIIAEAEIVNRLATTSSAKIDSIEFRDMQFQIDLDGDPVTVRGENGNTLEPNPDGSINVIGDITVDMTGVEDRLDTVIAQQLGGKLVPERFDSVRVTSRNNNGDITAVVYKLGASTVATLSLTYDSNGDFESVVKS